MSLLPNIVRDSSGLIARLRVRYPEPEHAFFEEVSNAAGFSRSRSADAIAMNTWPSRGLTIHGFEVKVDRSDWVRELKDPAKAEAFVKRCHCWWLVLGDAAIVHPGELPQGWGLLVPHGKGLKVVVEAERREPELSLHFLAALMRRAVELRNKPPEDQAKAVEAAHAAGLQEGLSRQQARVERSERHAQDLGDAIRQFEQASGMTFDMYRATELGDAVRVVYEQRVGHLAGRIGGARFEVERAIRELTGVAARLTDAESRLSTVSPALGAPLADPLEAA